MLTKKNLTSAEFGALIAHLPEYRGGYMFFGNRCDDESLRLCQPDVWVKDGWQGGDAKQAALVLAADYGPGDEVVVSHCWGERPARGSRPTAPKMELDITQSVWRKTRHHRWRCVKDEGHRV